MSLDPAMASFVPGFVQEALTLCGKLAASVLELETERSQAAAHAAARTLHTLKGSAGTLGFQDLVEVAHALEDVLKPAAKGTAALPAGIVDVMVSAVDQIQRRLEALGQGRDEPLSIAAGLEGQLSALKAAPGPNAAPSIPPAVTPSAAAVPATAPPMERQLRHLIDGSERLRETWLKLEEHHRALSRVSERVPAGAQSAVRVELEALALGFKSDLAELKEVTDSLEGGVRELTTRPVESFLPSLQRGVRDLCRQLGKQARLSMVGGEISVDRQVADALNAILTHLLRNAVDHGIEQPHVRERHGKHGTGLLEVRAERQANVLFLTVSDDGAGIDLDAVRRAALERSLVSEAELAAMGERELLQLVFRSSLSTRREVTAISGRGVGLDVVRDEVQRLKGTIEVQSVKGAGTHFTLALPVVYGSAPYLVLRVGETPLALPASAVDRMLRLDAAQLQAGPGGFDLKLGEELVPLRDLGGLLGLREPLEPKAKAAVLVVYSQGKRAALLVDELEGERELVLQVLPTQLSRMPHYQGVVTLGRGDLCLVLRPRWLVDDERAVATPANDLPRALVVDDSLTARALHRSMLEAGGYRVHAASSAEQALELLAHSSYRVMVSDVGMEPTDGYRLTEQVRACDETAQLPIVLVSAHDDPEHRSLGLRAGADAFLSKRECASGRLLGEVNAAIARRRKVA